MKNESKYILGDPSLIKQEFTDVKLKIWCCRYWRLNLWDCHDMVFPFWRIYWNKNLGGILKQSGNTHVMDSETIYIIPPFTSFSSQYKKNHQFNQGINVSGRHMSQTDNESLCSEQSLLHLFIHFNLGIPFDNVFPGIYKVKTTASMLERLDYLTERLKIEHSTFHVTYTLKLQSIIKEILSNIGPELFKTLNVDHRILSVIRHIENHINEDLTNSKLAEVANMATNSFSRLFKQKMEITLHNFIMKRKIAQSCELFSHTNKSIEEVAFDLGFSDRYHFSRVFKLITGTTPAVYKAGKFS